MLISPFLQSQCSSQERLHQLGAAAAAAGGYHHGTTPAPAGTPIGHVPEASPDPRHFSSNDSNPSLIDDEGRRSPSIRPRSRSLRYAQLRTVLENDQKKYHFHRLFFETLDYAFCPFIFLSDSY